MIISYKYEFIKNVGDNWKELASSELESLAPIWFEQAERLKESEALNTFNQQLSREWAIETGIIENLYTLDRGITQLLIERGLEASLIPHGTTNKSPEEVVSIIKDQQNALEGLFHLVNETRDLSVSFIKQLHQTITRSQTEVEAVDSLGNFGTVKLEKGIWKKFPNNPTRPDGQLHEYCPPEHVAAEMDNLIAFYQDNVKRHVSTEVLAAWLHHRFTQIHPFQDGNGRIARAIASLVFIKGRWFPVVITREIRSEYIQALEEADHGNLTLLIQLFTALQKKAFLKALSLSEQILEQEKPVSQVLISAFDRIRDRKNSETEKLYSVFKYGEELQKLIASKLEVIKGILDEELPKLDERYFTYLDISNEQNDFWFRYQIINIAKNTLNYFADTRTYRKWVRLKISEDRRSEIVFSIHSVGTQFVGLLAVSAFIFFKDATEDLGDLSSDMHSLCSDLFQFSYNEDYKTIEKRFGAWVDKAIIAGIEEWRRQL